MDTPHDSIERLVSFVSSKAHSMFVAPTKCFRLALASEREADIERVAQARAL